MNIFENYLLKIYKLIKDNKDLTIKKFDNLKDIEVPPEHFNYDLSTNVSLILSKENKINPIDLSNKIKGYS